MTITTISSREFNQDTSRDAKKAAAREPVFITDRGRPAHVLLSIEAQADVLVRYPLNPDFMSLNLAQAVMVLAYEWWMAADETPVRENDDA